MELSQEVNEEYDPTEDPSKKLSEIPKSTHEKKDGRRLTLRLARDDNVSNLNLKRNVTVSLHRIGDRKGLFRQWASSVIVGISYFILGTALGWPSPVIYEIFKTQKPVELTHLDSTIMVTLFYAGNLFMPFPSGLLSDSVGRKASLLYLTILPVACWVLVLTVAHKAMLHVARFLMGMYSGLALTVLPMYLGEIAEPKVRGKLASILQLFTNCGLLFSYIVGAYTSYQTFAIILLLIPCVHFFLLLLIPESPYWYTYKGKVAEAAKTLAWLRGGNVLSTAVEVEAGVISTSVESDKDKPHSILMLLKTKSYRKALIIVEVFSMSQRLSGISALMAYISISIPVLTEYGLTANLCAVITGIANITGVVVALPCVDRFGRIPLMITSCIGCGIAMLLAAVWYYMNDSDIHAGPLKWGPLALFCLYGLFMNFGLGPIPTTIQGEMFPSHLKGRASAITVMVLAASSVVVNFSYIPISDAVGFWFNFMGYSCVCVICLIFTWTFAIETKGKTLQEIQTRLAE